MGFDPSTARPVGEFDPATAQEYAPPIPQSRAAPSGMMGRPGSIALPDPINRAVGLWGRTVANAAAAVPLMAAEAGAGIGNLVNRAVGREGNYSPTADFNSLLTRAGLPEPQTKIEKATDFVGTALLGAKMPGQSPLPQAATPAEKVIAEGAKRQVPVFYDDVGGNTAKKVGTLTDNLGSLGTGAGREIQGKAAQSAARELVDDYAVASDDVPMLIQQGLQRRLAGLRKGASALYARVDQALAPNGPVDVSAVKAAITARIAKERQLGSVADESTIKTLEKYLDAPDGDFAHWRKLRSVLGADISDYYTGKGAIGSRGVDALQEIKTLLDDAMAAHAKKAGGRGYAEWRRADEFYRSNIVPFKEAGFRDLVKTGEPEKAWRYLLANNTESRALRLYNGLDRKGREAVKFGLLRAAEEAATTPKGTFSPARFAKYLEDHDKAIGVFFRGSQKADIDGFRNLMRHIERAGQYAENPPTGNRLVMPLLGGAAYISPEMATGIAGSGLATRALFQTQRGRNFLLLAAKLKPGTPEMARLLDSINRFVAASSEKANADGQ